MGDAGCAWLMLTRPLPVIAGLLSASVALPALLVVGLLSFPSSCACGAVMPHDHSLFVLSAHHHAARHHDARRNAIEAHDSGAAFHTPSTSSVGEPHTLSISPWPSSADEQPTRVARSAGTSPDGVRVLPATPPPRG
jgi:hypothetical protein